MNSSFRTISQNDVLSDLLKAKIFQMDQELMNPCWSLESWEDFFKNNHFRLFLLLDDEQVAGFSLFLINVPDHHGHLLKICTRRHGRGDGRKLLEKSFDELKMGGIYNFYLEVEFDNQRAISLYDRFSLTKSKMVLNFYGTGRHAYKYYSS